MADTISPVHCPDDHSLVGLVRAEVSDVEAESLLAHVESCSRCEARLAQIEADASRIELQPPGETGDNGDIASDPPTFSQLDPLASTDDGRPRGPAPTRAAVRTDGSATIPPGTRIGDHEVIAEIARGGMGVVLRARHVELGREVALKIIRSDELASGEEVRRFRAEAEAAARLDHPGIVPVLDVGTDDGRHWFTMALVEGGSLRDLVRDDVPAARRVAEIVRDIALAVHYAHVRNIVHRDLKPANVLLDPNGLPKVTDFGLAKNIERDSGLTATGQVMGTPSYMSPEQALGRTHEVGPLTDVYALGGILYFLLTGRPPFQGENVVSTLRDVVERDPVPPRRSNGAVDIDLETICLKCLEKDAEARYPSAAAVAAELDRYLGGHPIEARPLSTSARTWRWCRRNPVVASLLSTSVALLVAVAGVATWGYFSTSSALQAVEERNRRIKAGERVTRIQRDEIREQRDEIRQRLAVTEAFRLAAESRLARDENPQRSLLLGMAAIEATTDTGAGTQFVAERNLREALGEIGGTPLVGHNAPITTSAVSPDGTRLVTGDAHGGVRLWRLDADDARATSVELSKPRDDGHRASSAAFGPKGEHVAIGFWHPTEPLPYELRLGPNGANPFRQRPEFGSTIRVWAVEGDGPPTTVAEHSGRGPTGVLQFSPGGDWLFAEFESVTDAAPPFSPRGRRQLRELHAVPMRASAGERRVLDFTHGHWNGSRAALPGVRARVNPESVLVVHPNATLGVHDVTTDRDPNIVDTRVLVQKPGSWSRNSIRRAVQSTDGRWVAFAHNRPGGAFGGSRGGTVHLFDATTLDDEEPVRHDLAHPQSIDGFAIGHDASRVATVAGGVLRVWDREEAGYSEAPRTITIGTQLRSLRILVNGGVLAAGHDDVIRLWPSDTDAEPIVLRDPGESLDVVSVSPDGRWLVTGGSRHRVLLWDLESKAPSVSARRLNGHEEPVLNAHFGGKLLVTVGAERACRVWSLTPPDGALPIVRGRSGMQVRILPDHRRWLVADEGGAISLRRAEDGFGNPFPIPLPVEGKVLSKVVGNEPGTAFTGTGADGELVVYRLEGGAWRTIPVPGATLDRGLSLSRDGHLLVRSDPPAVWTIGEAATATPLRLPAIAEGSRLSGFLGEDGTAVVVNGPTHLPRIVTWTHDGTPIETEVPPPVPIDRMLLAPTNESGVTYCTCPTGDLARDPRSWWGMLPVWRIGPNGAATLTRLSLALPDMAKDHRLVVIDARVSPGRRWFAACVEERFIAAPRPKPPPGVTVFTTPVPPKPPRRSAVLLWDLERPGTEPIVLADHPGPRFHTGLEFSADGHRLIGPGEQSNGFFVWTRNDDAWTESRLLRHESTVQGRLLTPDGRYLVGWNSDGRITVYDLESANPNVNAVDAGTIANLVSKTSWGPLSSLPAVITAGGRSLVVVDRNGRILECPLTTEALVDLAREIAARDFTDHERRAFGLGENPLGETLGTEKIE